MTWFTIPKTIGYHRKELNQASDSSKCKCPLNCYRYFEIPFVFRKEMCQHHLGRWDFF